MVPPGQSLTAVVLILGLAPGPAEVPPQPEEAAPSVDVQPDADAEASVDAQPDADASVDAQPPADAESAEAAEAPAEAQPSAVPGDPAAPPEASPVEEDPAPTAEQPLAAEAEDDPLEDEDDWEDGDESWDDDYDPLRDSPEARTAQRRIVGGAVLLGLGTLTSFGALAMGLSDPCANRAGNSCSEEARNRAALTMGLPGVAAMATGAVMLGLGIRQRKALRVDASLSRAGGVLTVSGRF